MAKKVRVDSTWHQPDGNIHIHSEWNTWNDDESMDFDDLDEPETIDPDVSYLLGLDDDSLFSLFDRCDHLSLANLSMTCSRLAQLLKSGNYYFPNHKIFEYDELSLVDTENIFRLMGRYFEKLDVWFEETASDQKVFDYVRCIAKYCQDGKVQDLSVAINCWKNEIWLQLSSILKNLTKLRVCVGYLSINEEVKVDFTALCPNLKTLNLWDSFIVDQALTKYVPSLTTFIWPYSWDELLEELESYQFFYQNRQLKVFECNDFNFGQMPLTLLLMPYIDTLTIYVSYRHDVSSVDINKLKNLQNLRNLTLGLEESRSLDKKQIIDSFEQLEQLVELKLYFWQSINDQDPVINLSTKLAHLEHLELRGVRLSERIVADFVQVSTKVKTIHFHNCDIYATESLLAHLKTVVAKSNQRHRSGCSLFIGEDGRNSLVRICDGSVKSIAWVCKHRFTR